MEIRDEAKITRGLIEMLKNTQNKEVSEYFKERIMNNDEANGSYIKVMELLKERFQKSEGVKLNEMVIELQKFSWDKDDTAKVLSKLTNLREKLHQGRQIGEGAEFPINTDDKILETLFIETGRKEGKLDKIEINEIEKVIREKKYDWAQFKEIVRTTKVEKEIISNVNETAYMDRGRPRTNSFKGKSHYQRPGSKTWRPRPGSNRLGQRSGSSNYQRSGSGGGYNRQQSTSPIRKSSGADNSYHRNSTPDYNKVLKEMEEVKKSIKELTVIVNKVVTKDATLNTSMYVNNLKLNVNDVMWTQDEERRVIMDSGAPKSVAGKDWIRDHLKAGQITEDKISISYTNDAFKFGPGKTYESLRRLVIPIPMKDRQGKVKQLWTQVHEIQKNYDS